MRLYMMKTMIAPITTAMATDTPTMMPVVSSPLAPLGTAVLVGDEVGEAVVVE